MENSEIARMFELIADMREFRGDNAFRVRSYRNAARTVRDLSQRVEDLVAQGEDLTQLPYVGKSIAEKMREMVQTGTCRTLEELRKEIPPELTELLHVPRLGAQGAKQVHEKLGVSSLAELRQACEDQRVRELPGMGAKSEENVLKGIRTLESASGRVLLKEAVEQIAAIGRHLDNCDAVVHWEPAGSYRRRKETIGDLDILIKAEDRDAVTQHILHYGAIEEVLGKGEEKVSVVLGGGLQVDFRYFDAHAFGTALMYFTGSKAHNIAVRQRVQDKGWKLNEYGLYEDDHRIAGETEEEVYAELGLDWIAPELREGRGELEAAAEGNLPHLIESGDIKGDLHCHSTASDGVNSVAEMVQAARRLGYEYLCIADHSKAVSIANGLDAERLQEHLEHIREVDAAYEDFWLLAGIEVDILKDGTLDLPESLLRELDWVTASTHFYLELSEEEMTRRLVAAVETGVVDCIAHPFMRLIGKRDMIQFDVDRVFEACRANGVCVEVNAHPERLDLPDIYARHARDMGLGIVLDTDAHSGADLGLINYGVGMARRGWLQAADVMNTKPAGELREWIRTCRNKKK